MNDHLAQLTSALADRYTIERELGRGGMATVYLAEDLKHERKVAIKAMHPELAATLGVDRFLREIKIAAKLSHPHILGVFDSGRAVWRYGGTAVESQGEFLYYVMPYVEGESLRDRLNRERQLPIEDALKVTSEVASALSYAHAQGVIHRDIKPENIMLSAGGAVVADFGIARAVSVAGGEQLTQTGMAVGTPAYMSPEQASADQVDARSDLYSLGSVLYEMLGGDPPFTGTTPQAILARKMSDTAPSLRPLRDTVSDGLEQVVLRSLARSPADRYSTAELFVEALTAAQRGEAAPTVVVRREAKPKRLFAAVGAVVLLAAVVMASVFLSRQDSGGVILDPNRVAVAVFRNVTGDSSLNHVGERVGHWITQGVQQAALPVALWDVALESWNHVENEVEANRVSDPIRAFAEQTGAGTVVSGAVYLVGDSLEVQVNLTDVLRGIPLGHVEPVRGSRSSESEVISATQERVRATLALRYGEDVFVDVAGSIGEPPSLEAYQAFAAGARSFRSRDFEGMRRHWERAARLDTTWAYPLIQLSVLYRGYGGRNLSDSVLRLAEAFGDRLTPYERAAVEASRAFLDGDRERSLIALRQAAELAPTSSDAMQRAIVTAAMNRPHESVAAFEVLLSRSAWADSLTQVWAQFSSALFLIGDYRRALDAAKRAFVLDPDGGFYGPVFARRFQIGPLAGLGRVDELQELLNEMMALPDQRRVGGALVASVEYLHAFGHKDAAREVGEQVIPWFEAGDHDEVPTLDNRHNHFLVLFSAGLHEEAKALIDALVQDFPDSVDIRVSRIVMDSQRGDTVQAQRDSEWLDNLEVWNMPEPRRTRARGVIAGALGDLAGAVNLLRESTLVLTRYDWSEMWYAPLRGYEPFEELVAPKG